MEEQAPEEIKILTAGEMLRQAREAQGLTINEVASRLNLRPALVRDLEENRFVTKTSVETFIRGYLRGYARLLKLSEEDVISSYEDLIGKKEALQEEMIKRQQEQANAELRKRYLKLSGIAAAVLAVAASGVVLIGKFTGSSATDAVADNTAVSSEVLPDTTVEPLPIADTPLYVAAETPVGPSLNSDEVKQREFEAMQQAVKDGKKTDVAIQDTIKTMDRETGTVVAENPLILSTTGSAVQNDSAENATVAPEKENIESPVVTADNSSPESRKMEEEPQSVADEHNRDDGEEIIISAQIEQTAYNEKQVHEVAPIIQSSGDQRDVSETGEKNSLDKDETSGVKEQSKPSVQLKSADTMKVPEAAEYIIRLSFSGDCWIGLYQGDRTLVNRVYNRGGVAEVTLNSLPAKLKIGAPENISASVNGIAVDLSLAKPKAPFRVDISN